jgi:hypothetical protein
MRCAAFCATRRAPSGGLDGRAPFGVNSLEEQRGRRDAGIVHHDRERPELGLRGIEGGLTEARSRTSSATGGARPSNAAISAAASSRRSTRRAAARHLAPARANTWAKCHPGPTITGDQRDLAAQIGGRSLAPTHLPRLTCRGLAAAGRAATAADQRRQVVAVEHQAPLLVELDMIRGSAGWVGSGLAHGAMIAIAAAGGSGPPPCGSPNGARHLLEAAMTVSPVPTADSGERSLPVRLALALTESVAELSSNSATRSGAVVDRSGDQRVEQVGQNESKPMAPVATPLVSASRSSWLAGRRSPSRSTPYWGSRR